RFGWRSPTDAVRPFWFGADQRQWLAEAGIPPGAIAQLEGLVGDLMAHKAQEFPSQAEELAMAIALQRQVQPLIDLLAQSDELTVHRIDSVLQHRASDRSRALPHPGLLDELRRYLSALIELRRAKARPRDALAREAALRVADILAHHGISSEGGQTRRH